MWWVGFVCVCLGSFLNIAALGNGNQIMLASSSSFSIIFNTIMSVHFLKEPLTRKDVSAIVLICLGSVLFLLNSKSDDTTYTTKELLALYLRPISIAFLIGSTVFILCVFTTDIIIKRQLREFYRCFEVLETPDEG